MEHNMARNPNWWEANKLAMLQAWLLEDLNSGPSAYKSTDLFFLYVCCTWYFTKLCHLLEDIFMISLHTHQAGTGTNWAHHKHWQGLFQEDIDS